MKICMHIHYNIILCSSSADFLFPSLFSFNSWILPSESPKFPKLSGKIRISWITDEIITILEKSLGAAYLYTSMYTFGNLKHKTMLLCCQKFVFRYINLDRDQKSISKKIPPKIWDYEHADIVWKFHSTIPSYRPTIDLIVITIEVLVSVQ